MKKLSPFVHIGTALALLVVAFCLVTFLPSMAPSPEPSSPPTYFVVAIIGFLALFLVRKEGLVWRYLPIPLITLFGFLEESSYGVESNIFQPIEWSKYNVEVYDLHNLVSVLGEIVQLNLKKVNWAFELASQYLLIDAILIGAVILFIALFLIVSRRKGSTREGVAPVLLNIFLILCSVAAIGTLVLLPTDPNNSFIGGYSATRLLLMLSLLAATVFETWFLRSQNKNLQFAEPTSSQSKLAKMLLVVVVLATVAFQVWSPLQATSGKLALVERFAPIAFWALASSVFVLVALSAWNGNLERMWQRVAHFFRTFFAENPAYVYVIVAILIILFAQAMDHYLVAFDSLIKFPNPWGEDWDYWIEETLEYIGSLELAAAVFFYTIGRPKTLKD